MSALLIAIGNTWRRDDGAAAHVVELLGSLPDVEMRVQIQPTPELSAEMDGADLVVFVDADVQPGEARIEPVQPSPPSPGTIGHSLRPGEILLMARELFDFKGECYLCRIPAIDFGEGEGLSKETEVQAEKAADLLRELLRRQEGASSSPALRQCRANSDSPERQQRP